MNSRAQVTASGSFSIIVYRFSVCDSTSDVDAYKTDLPVLSS